MIKYSNIFHQIAKFGLIIFAIIEPSFADQKSIVVTVDDLPGRNSTAGTTSQILNQIKDALVSIKAPATGFVIGKMVNDTESGAAALEDWSKAGLQLGNHTWFHQKYSSVDTKMFFEEVQKTENLIEPYRKKYGPWPRSFRFPMLDQGKSKEQERVANAYFEKTKSLLAHVSVDTSDWAFAEFYEKALKDPNSLNSQKIQDLYLEHIFDCVSYAEAASSKLFGRQIPQILLLHANALNAAAMGQVLKKLTHMGYRFITLGEALKDAVYAPYSYRIIDQPADHAYAQFSKTIGKSLPSGRDRTSYRYFQEFWEPKIKASAVVYTK